MRIIIILHLKMNQVYDVKIITSENGIKALMKRLDTRKLFLGTLYFLMCMFSLANRDAIQERTGVAFDWTSEEMILHSAMTEYAYNTGFFFLGRLYEIGGAIKENPQDSWWEQTDDKYLNSIGRDDCSILLRQGYFAGHEGKDNQIVSSLLQPGYILRIDGKDRMILQLRPYANGLVECILDGPNLNYKSVCDMMITAIDNEGREIPKIIRIPYTKSIGLQGLVARFLGGIFGNHHFTLIVMEILSCVLLSIVLTEIVSEISSLYGNRMAMCFFAVYILSPWLICFSTSAYWMPSLWFVPMLIEVKFLNNKFSLRATWIFMFLAIFIKCLCGYEFLPVIASSSVVFICTEWCVSRDAKRKRHLLHAVVALFSSTVAAFSCAMLVHMISYGQTSKLSIVDSLIEYFNTTILRRTLGGDSNNFDPIYRESLEAGILQTIWKYMNFQTDIFYCISGKISAMLFIIPFAALALLSVMRRRLLLKPMILYSFSYLSGISWYILGKSHSWIHVHINYVLLYICFIPICVYTMLDLLIQGPFREIAHRRKE